ncbi:MULTISPECIES: iron ABC transporter permease [Rhodococcus]|uniref:Iron ABC transporter permease n=2 Tax=Rhodococcus TaxID=1827 RepID=A0A059MV16_9NOCA|nr:MULTISPECIES: iron ABC transporter permease [Rhodococcus]ETT24701.1 ABC-type transporter, integral membrane subunit [Rhodococcus rhodochrous ATCC 21198]AKE88682.1 iron ABC transporter [Rhodococcus aetherivorans]ANZ26641.1 iron ABC transporter [Rhodococcus sp. WB1]KDE14842.1 iron ABC transporter [Rhodococcus aetherivorans]MBC2591667.1 iron ABC transporter permease [Rhodococcus aetherivorans]
MTPAGTLADASAPHAGAAAPAARGRDGGAARRSLWLILPPLLAALVLALAGAVSLGTVNIPFGDVWAIVAHRLAPGAFTPWWTAAREAIVVESRLPRALTAAVVGAALAIAGVVAQAVTRNPLADPYLLGVSSGAGFGVVLVTVLGVGSGALGAFTLPFAAFLGALFPLAGAIAVSLRAHAVTAIVLVGVAMSMVFSAATTFTLLVLGDDRQIGTVMRWLAGGFGDATWSMLAAPALVLLTVGGGVLLCGRQLNLLLVGDDGATALGMDVRRFRILILLAVSLLTAAAVAVSGTVGFIGLLIPHIAGHLVGRNTVRLIPVAAVAGALALVLADMVARSVSGSTELPVGVVTGLLGAPAFLVMLWRSYGRAR